MQKSVVIVEIEKGSLQEVFCNDPNIEIIIVDWDVHRDETNSVIKTEDGNELPVKAAVVSKSQLKDMTPETSSATHQALDNYLIESVTESNPVVGVLAKYMEIANRSGIDSLECQAFKRTYGTQFILNIMNGYECLHRLLKEI